MSDISEEDRQLLEQRVRGGEWLTPGQVAAVLGVARSAVHNWLLKTKTPNGKDFRSRTKRGSRHRLVNPEDVVAVLDE